MARAVLITGSNVGNVAENIERARDYIASEVGKITAESEVIGSEAWGKFNEEHTGNFLNQVIVVETDLEPLELLETLQTIERKLGRDSSGKNLTHDEKLRRGYSSRSMDIDILFYDERTISTVELTIPHPMIPRRKFVLEPLFQVMPEYRHPAFGKTIQELLEEL